MISNDSNTAHGRFQWPMQLKVNAVNTEVNLACFFFCTSCLLTSTRSSLLVRTQFSSGNVSQRLSNVVMLSLQEHRQYVSACRHLVQNQIL